MNRHGRTFLALIAIALASFAAAPARAAEATYLPSGTAAAEPFAKSAPGIGPATAIGAALLAAYGGWLLLRGRKLRLPGRPARKLAIEETRALGGRQYLVVASYEGKKLLLGVCPGRIDLLTALSEAEEPQGARWNPTARFR